MKCFIGITVRAPGDLQQKSSHEAKVILGTAVIDDVLGVVLLFLNGITKRTKKHFNIQIKTVTGSGVDK